MKILVNNHRVFPQVVVCQHCQSILQIENGRDFLWDGTSFVCKACGRVNIRILSYEKEPLFLAKEKGKYYEKFEKFEKREKDLYDDIYNNFSNYSSPL